MAFKNQAQQEEATQAARWEQAKRDAITAVYQRFPALIQCDANARMIVEVINRWTGYSTDVLPSFDLFLSALDENSGAMKMFATQPVERTKQQIIEEILSLVASKNDGRDGKFSFCGGPKSQRSTAGVCCALHNEELRMASWSLEALRVRLNEVKVKQQLQPKSANEIRADLAALRPQQRADGYSTLPEYLVLPWEVQARKVSAALLRNLAKTDFFYYKRLVKLYGAAQITERQNS